MRHLGATDAGKWCKDYLRRQRQFLFSWVRTAKKASLSLGADRSNVCNVYLDLPLFEIALVLVRLNHVVRFIVNGFAPLRAGFRSAQDDLAIAALLTLSFGRGNEESGAALRYCHRRRKFFR